MANHLNDLLLQTLKEINVRLDRLDSRMDRLDSRMDHLDSRIDHVIDTKADKTALDAANQKLDVLSAKLDTKADKADLDATNQTLDTLDGKVDTLGHRVERIEAGIGTLKWVIGAEVAVIGVILAFIKAC